MLRLTAIDMNKILRGSSTLYRGSCRPCILATEPLVPWEGHADSGSDEHTSTT